MLCFISKRSTREQTAQIFLLRGEFLDGKVSVSSQDWRVIRQFNRKSGSIIQTSGEEQVAIARGGDRTGNEIHHNWLAGCAGDLQYFFRNLGGRAAWK